MQHRHKLQYLLFVAAAFVTKKIVLILSCPYSQVPLQSKRNDRSPVSLSLHRDCHYKECPCMKESLYAAFLQVHGPIQLSASTSANQCLSADICLVQVPLWDMLNHVTGKCNVRLHHSQKRGVFQMFATQPIKQGEDRINN